jgi:mRNA interferase RelE/StbE
MARIEWTRSAFNEARKAPFDIIIKMIEAISRYAENPKSAIDAKAMQGAENCFRIRVRDWRLIFIVENETLTVNRIAPRGSAYR